MTEPELPLILEAEQLLPRLGDEQLLIIDLSDPETHRAYHVPGAVHLPYQQLTCELPPGAGELSPQAPLARVLNRIGLRPGAHVIAYDNEDNGRAARLLWTLDLVGHPHYSLLNGGLPAWLDERHPVEEGDTPPEPVERKFNYQPDGSAVDLLYLLQHLNDSSITLLDARTPEEFSGREIRARRGGHIPGAVNLDHRRVLAPEHSMRLKPEKELNKIIKELKIKPKQEIITYCHTHRRSALLYIALKSLGFDKLKAYPGSWAEWGNNLDTPVE